jgi:hypothetical protein
MERLFEEMEAGEVAVSAKPPDWLFKRLLCRRLPV